MNDGRVVVGGMPSALGGSYKPLCQLLLKLWVDSGANKRRKGLGGRLGIADRPTEGFSGRDESSVGAHGSVLDSLGRERLRLVRLLFQHRRGEAKFGVGRQVIGPAKDFLDSWVDDIRLARLERGGKDGPILPQVALVVTLLSCNLARPNLV